MRPDEEIMPAGGEGGEQEDFSGGCPASGSQGRPGGWRKRRRMREEGRPTWHQVSDL